MGGRDSGRPAPTIGLFVSCLVDVQRPSIGFATIDLLEAQNCRVQVPRGQTCCGQPSWNGGDAQGAARLLLQTAEAFTEMDYVVTPTASCTAMLTRQSPEVMAAAGLAGAEKVAGLAAKTYELTAFLVDVLGVDSLPVRYDGIGVLHESCSALRGLNSIDQTKKLLAGVEGLEMRPLQDAEICCGFGGAFSIKHEALSARMATAKAEAIRRSGADTLVGTDLGCLLTLAGRLHRLGARIRVRHIAEILAGTAYTGSKGIPPLGGHGSAR